MATLKRKDRSPYWHGIYKLANGKFRSRSTKTTQKREARRIVNEWEVEEQKIREGKSEQAREVREFIERYFADQHRKGWNNSTLASEWNKVDGGNVGLWRKNF